MADYTQTPQGGFAPHVHPEYSVAPSGGMGKFANIAGAVVSLALVVGVGVWGYKLLVRDVSGIPIVRATAGDMRVRPEDPGGQLAQNQGLSVNTVTSDGASEARAQEVRLAPVPTDLEDEDQPMAQVAATAPRRQQPLAPVTAEPEATEPAAQAPAAQDIAAALESGSVDDLVAQLTNGVAPLEPTSVESAPVVASVTPQAVPELLTGEGVQVSLRPALRPNRSLVATNAVAVSAPAAASNGEIAASSLPAGTRLVQLGAFDSPEIARAQWGQLSARFTPFMEGKQRIVMEAKSGGRTFYRLRAMGFEDIGDARRFCSALLSESVDCIPVVTR